MLLSWLWPLSCSARNHFHTVHIHILQSNRLHCWEKSNFSWLLLTYGNFQDEIEFSDGGVNIWKVHVYVISRWPARPPEAQASQRVKPPTLPFPDHQTSHCLWLLAGPGSALWACGPAQVCVLRYFYFSYYLVSQDSGNCLFAFTVAFHDTFFISLCLWRRNEIASSSSID